MAGFFGYSVNTNWDYRPNWTKPRKDLTPLSLETIINQGSWLPNRFENFVIVMIKMKKVVSPLLRKEYHFPINYSANVQQSKILIVGFTLELQV